MLSLVAFDSYGMKKRDAFRESKSFVITLFEILWILLLKISLYLKRKSKFEMYILNKNLKIILIKLLIKKIKLLLE